MKRIITIALLAASCTPGEKSQAVTDSVVNETPPVRASAPVQATTPVPTLVKVMNDSMVDVLYKEQIIPSNTSVVALLGENMIRLDSLGVDNTIQCVGVVSEAAGDVEDVEAISVIYFDTYADKRKSIAFHGAGERMMEVTFGTVELAMNQLAAVVNNNVAEKKFLEGGKTKDGERTEVSWFALMDESHAVKIFEYTSASRTSEKVNDGYVAETETKSEVMLGDVLRGELCQFTLVTITTTKMGGEVQKSDTTSVTYSFKEERYVVKR